MINTVQHPDYSTPANIHSYICENDFVKKCLEDKGNKSNKKGN